jgi:NAD(P)-dependent dehydrogenase (short-subunit alcohol dehydrogenase family)
MELQNRVAIVTGASRGIGRQIALDLAKGGARVVVAARTVEKRKNLPGTIHETLDEIKAAGGEAIAVQADVTQTEDLKRLIDATVAAFGGLDILINNAAATTVGAPPIESYDRAQWLQEFDSNIHGPFTLIALAVPHMRERGGGVIVNVTSMAGDLRDQDLSQGAAQETIGFGIPPLLGYAATKAALNRLTNAVAPQLAASNIAIACLEPGFTRTEYVDLMQSRGRIDATRAHSTSMPAAKALEIITSANPLVYSGKIVRTEQ